MDLRVRAAKWLYEKFRPTTPQASETSFRERLKRFVPSFHMPKLSIVWIFALALIGISTAIATIVTVWVYGFPEMPQVAWPRFQFNWSAVRIIAIGLGFVTIFLWLVLKIQKRKRVATSTKFAPKPQVPAPSAAAVSAVKPAAPVPPVATPATPTPPAAAPATPFVAVSVPAATTPTPTALPPIAPTRRHRAPRATTVPPPASPAPAPAVAIQQQPIRTGFRPYVGYIGLAFGLAATLVLYFSRNGGGEPAPAALEVNQTEGVQGTPQAGRPAQTSGVVLNVGDEVIVKATSECSPTYRLAPDKFVRIEGVDPQRHYLLETVSGKYKRGPGQPPVPGNIPRVRICSIDDEEVEVWIAVEELPQRTEAAPSDSTSEPPPLEDGIPEEKEIAPPSEAAPQEEKSTPSQPAIRPNANTVRA